MFWKLVILIHCFATTCKIMTTSIPLLVSSEKEQEVVVNKNLVFREPVTNAVTKANGTLGIITVGGLYNLDRTTIMLLHKALVRLILWYSLQEWSPFFWTWGTSFWDLNLFLLTHKRLKGDMFFTFKYFNGLINTDHKLLQQVSADCITRGNTYKIATPKYKTLSQIVFYSTLNRPLEFITWQSRSFSVFGYI